MKFKFPLSTTTWGQEEYAAMQRVIDSGMFTMDKNVRLFEKKFSNYIGSSYSVMVNSGSSANLLMIAALFYTKNKKLKLNRGDEVIVPAVSWSTTYYPLYQYGLKIKFVDIDLNTLNYDLEQLSFAVTNKTRMIMAVNLLGNPNDFDRINQIIGERNIVLLEDNCESLGASFNEKKAGTFGVMGSFSSFFSHHICTMEGGLIVTDDEELYHILLSLRAHGWTRDLPKNNHISNKKNKNSFEELFRFVLPGFNVRPLELEAALGLEQLRRLPSMIVERRKNGKFLQKIMKDHPDIIIQQEIGRSSWFGFSIVIRSDSKLTRKQLLVKLKKKGFECRPIVTGNFVKNAVVKYFDYEVHGKLKNADLIDKKGLFVGNHHYPILEAIMLLKSI
jgi:CDP-6-deoxy-D-xylo-4-hexulose-3-dehydrase